MNTMQDFCSMVERESASVVACAERMGPGFVRKTLHDAILILQHRLLEVDSVGDAVRLLGASPLHNDAATAALCTVVFIVAKALDLRPQSVMQGGRDFRGTYARHVCMYLAWSILGLSMPQIARFFNRKDHSTTLYARNRIQAEIDAGKVDAAQWREVTMLTRKCAERHGLACWKSEGAHTDAHRDVWARSA